MNVSLPLSHNVYCVTKTGNYIILKMVFEGVVFLAFLAGIISIIIIIAAIVGAI